MKPVRWLAVFLFVWGLVALHRGLGMPPLRDEAAFHEAYMKLAVGDAAERSEKYGALRAAHLTPAYRLQDYGVCLMLVGFLGWISPGAAQVVLWLGRSRLRAFLLGCSAVLIALVAYVGSLHVDFDRGMFPFWADSIAIPLTFAGPMGLVLSLWMLLHWALVAPHASTKLRMRFAGAGCWLAVPTTLTAVLIVYSAAIGDPWTVAAGLPWLLLYLVAWASRGASTVAHVDASGHPGAPART